MGKRSAFERRPRDFYPTPYEAVKPLLPFLHRGTRFIEPCAGDGRLIDHLKQNGHTCVYACDIEPQREDIVRADALLSGDGLMWNKPQYPAADMFITNPPWKREILHPMIDAFMETGGVAWLLFDAAWMHTTQAIPYKHHVTDVVSIGRVQWIEGSNGAGKDDCAWYRFRDGGQGSTTFHWRT